MMNSDTIAALASAPGMGAVALVRVSGPDAFTLFGDSLKAVPKSLSAVADYPDRQAVLARLLDADGEIVDEVLATCFHGPRSFTGEDVVELACHGGVLVTRRVLERLHELGIRAASPGEFSHRAFLNGKMDLTQAEAIMDLISAQTELGVRAAHEQLQGKLGNQSEQIRTRLIELTAHVEAYIDFPDEDIDPETGDELVNKVDVILAGIDKMLASSEQGRIIREGVRTVIAGEPNAGKSSLLNCLLGYERAIVSDLAGTTRDTVEEVVNVQGIPLRLVDTAGMRETEDVIEQQGVERAKMQLQQADLVLEVVDVSKPHHRAVDAASVQARHHILILNKSDLGEDSSWAEVEGVRISCKQDHGVDELGNVIINELSMGEGEWGGHAVAINARHQDCLKRARVSMLAGREALVDGVSSEFISMDLRDAMDSIGEIAGRIDTDDVLDQIFSTFCLGK
ncbi:tRNA uridine-5-carboxymethylaminomethyl(34) synthesis GTPase MnmE [Persicirhabdus sediminis]|uniref:tRNA modification GTPase MnmE n=1 Tax=Persicirhabdus sediminis TaxID=454144 RepID=A0A8J7MCT5_9BACT|nr:tRNA uridine-5-carboxymethylaminomethyl(34) synthesis GTPase MnmE [Persicirhabdus sediminis]MBK1790147.1 tRNA uridine-5-carboxymethylaminomethyl(34) synthesis GTPase MnmE [Persicirhabdus sediminis]